MFQSGKLKNGSARSLGVRHRLGVEMLEDRCQPSAGVLDPTFGIGGQVTPAVTARAGLVQPWDSKIVVAGSTSGVMALARYNTDGSLDGAFGSGGTAVSNIAGSGVAALYPQAGTADDGKIVEAGGSSVVRFQATGGIDSGFGTQGKATLPWSGSVASVIVQPDGKVVVSGFVFLPSTSPRTIDVTRFNTNGTVDNSFGTNGTWQTTLSGTGLYPPAGTIIYGGETALEPDGKLLVAVPRAVLTPGFGWGVVRLTTVGAVDTTFTQTFTTFGTVYNGTNGAALPRGLAIYPQTDAADAGKILTVGHTFTISGGPPGGATVLARYNADGAFDTTFGAGGKVVTTGGGTVAGVAIQADGKVIVVGSTMQRYNTDGALDTSFGDSGFVYTAYSGVAIQPDGKIDVANTTALARYMASDEPPPPPPSTYISINDVSVNEGNAGTSSMNFTVTLSAAIADQVTVQFLTADGSATSGSDYQSTGGTLTFAPGETSQTISIPIIGDRLGESDESLFVNLSNAVNAGYADSQGVGTITDDEPRILINDVSMTEGNSGTKSFVFTVTLSAAYDQAVTMSYQTADGTATTGNNDYVSKSGTLTFNPGETQKTITITVNGDKKRESDETFFVNLTGNSSNSLFADSQGIGTILNDD